MRTRATNRGFSFVETLIGIAILLTGISMPLILVYRSLEATSVARDQIVASYLAEEGVEYIRYIRDSNVLGGNSWLFRILPICNNSGTPCEIRDITNRYSNPQLKNCGGATCNPVKYNTATGLFGNAGSETTVFTRAILVVETVPNREAKVQVTVSWQPKNGPLRTTTLEERIFNWTGL